jgi:hypothetical protein
VKQFMLSKSDPKHLNMLQAFEKCCKRVPKAGAAPLVSFSLYLSSCADGCAVYTQ